MGKSDPSCPCGSGKSYDSCCGPYIEGRAYPETAVQLMRSRYTAFTQANDSYLKETWHPSTRPDSLDLDPSESMKWLGLRVDRVEGGEADDEQGVVCFVARWRVGGGAAQRQEECSRFVRVEGRWYYLDGEIGN